MTHDAAVKFRSIDLPTFVGEFCSDEAQAATLPVIARCSSVATPAGLRAATA
jgi:hypothetical protein